MIKTRLLVAACFTLAAVPVLAQSNSANEGAAATPEGTYAQPMTPPAPDQNQQAQDRAQQAQDQAQRQANSDPYNMPQNRDAYSTQPSEPATQNSEASGNGQAPSDADSGTSADRTNPAP